VQGLYWKDNNTDEGLLSKGGRFQKKFASGKVSREEVSKKKRDSTIQRTRNDPLLNSHERGVETRNIIETITAGILIKQGWKLEPSWYRSTQPGPRTEGMANSWRLENLQKRKSKLGRT